MNDGQITQRQCALVSSIRRTLPDFVKACADDVDVVLIHQDAFAAAYDHDEYLLLGMAIKYAGLYGKEVRVIGASRQTVEELVH